jgi:hypothetical protein
VILFANNVSMTINILVINVILVISFMLKIILVIYNVRILTLKILTHNNVSRAKMDAKPVTSHQLVALPVLMDFSFKVPVVYKYVQLDTETQLSKSVCLVTLFV